MTGARPDGRHGDLILQKSETNSMDLNMTHPAEETLYLLTEYYHHNLQPLFSVLADDCCWISPADQLIQGAEAIRGIFDLGMRMPVFHLKDAQFCQMPSGSPDQITVYGVYDAYSDLDNEMLLAAHQRVTFCYRREADGWKLYHMHVSNPWSQVSGDEVFPDEISRETYEYLQECIAAQKAQIEEQTALLERLSFEDDLTGLFNRNKFIQVSEHYKQAGLTRLGIASFDLNGLKAVNDQLGHVAGDQLICRTAYHIKQTFGGKAYRLGGDEFVVMDVDAEEADFYAAVASVKEHLSEEQISVSVGLSWHAAPCDMAAQFEEADRLMYQEKKQYHSDSAHDRRKRL